MQPHEERVVEEKRELDVNIEIFGHPDDWPPASYTGTACENCRRNRVEFDGVCEQCQHIATCRNCENEATCFGAYEGMEDGFSCDECCGHGCEDGFCNKLLEREERLAPK